MCAQMKGDRERVLEATSAAFDGLIAVVNPQDSWVARFQRCGKAGFPRQAAREFLADRCPADKLAPGTYAVHVSGTLPEHIQDDLDAAGITYRPNQAD